MEVRCERCRAQYVFADDQVGEHGLTVRCSNCGHLFKVKRKALVVTLPVGPEEGGAGAVSAADAHRAAAVQAAAQAVFAEAERREWTLRQPSGQTYTFKDMSTLHRWIVERKAHREDEICRPGEPWRRLGSIAELQSFFAVVEAAERAAQAPAPPPSQPTAVQFPAAAAPARVDQPSPLSVAARTEFFSAPPPAAPAAPRTEFFAPPPPAAPRTEFFVPPAAPPAAAPPTELFAPPPAPPPPAPPVSRLDGIFTPDPMPLAALAEGAAAPAASASGTEQGFPPPPAPVRAPGAAWEGQRPAPARATAREPAWTSADQQTGGTMVEGGVPAPKRRGAGPVLGVILGTGLVVGAAGWWFFLRQPEPASRPVVAAAPAPVPTLPPPAAPFVPPPAAKAPEPAPAVAQAAPVPAAPAGSALAANPEPTKAEPAKAEPAKTEPAQAEPAKPAEPAPAVAKAEPAPAAEPPPPARAEPAKAAAPAPEPPAEPPPAKAVAAKKPPPAKAAPRTAKSLVAEARKLRERGKTSQALDLYGRAVELQPENPDALAGRGWCYLELSQYGPAEASFTAALEADPEGADALLGLAETYRYEGKRREAVKYYERYLAAHPQGEDAVAAKNAIQQLKE